MRTISATLASAQRAAIRNDATQIIVDDRHVGIMRPRWATIQTDANNTLHTAICAAYNNNIIRARLNSTASTLDVQRITTPATVSQWTTWTQLVTSLTTVSPISLTADGNTVIALCYVDSDNRTIKIKQSTNNGATWSAAATVYTVAAGTTVTSLAASLNSGWEALYVMFTAEDTVTHQSHIYTTTRDETGTTWSTPVSWGRAIASNHYGLHIIGAGTVLHVVACHDNGLHCYNITPLPDMLTSWGAPAWSLTSDSATTLYKWPHTSLAFGSHYFIFFVEANTVTSVNRLQHTFSPDFYSFSFLPRPYQLTATYGAQITADSTQIYMATCNAAHKAPVWSASAAQRVDISADLLRLELTEKLADPGALQLRLRNDDSRYSAAGTSGTYQALTRGSQISVRLGYRTTAGIERLYYRPYWITAVTHQRRTGPAQPRKYSRTTYELDCTDGWGILQHVARQTRTWTSGTVLDIITDILRSHGFYVTNDSAPAWTTTVSTFTIQPGTYWGTAVRSLLNMIAACCVFQSDPASEATYPSAVAHLCIPASAAVYAYGTTHAVLAADHIVSEQPTHLTVYANATVLGDAHDWPDIERGNEDRPISHIDARLTSAANAATRAGNLLAQIQQQAPAGWILHQPNLAQECGDTVTVTNAPAGMAAATRLVLANRIILDRLESQCQQTTDLGIMPYTTDLGVTP